jgi:hypothetical protein
VQKPTIVALRLKGGRPPLEICLASADEADSWRKGIEGLLATREADARKRELMLELLADGAARKSLKARMTRKERKARESFLRTTGGPRLAMTDLEAALLLQRAVRGHRIRNIVRNWVKITAVDGDVYYCAWWPGRCEGPLGPFGSFSYPPPTPSAATRPHLDPPRYNFVAQTISRPRSPRGRGPGSTGWGARRQPTAAPLPLQRTLGPRLRAAPPAAAPAAQGRQPPPPQQQQQQRQHQHQRQQQ